MHKRFFDRLSRRRVIALVAAYAVALSSILATFAVARATAANAVQPDAVLCHHIDGGDAPPPSDDGNGKSCIAACCVGCLTLAAALPPAPAAVAAAPQASARIETFTSVLFAHNADRHSHRSRAPPLAA